MTLRGKSSLPKKNISTIFVYYILFSKKIPRNSILSSASTSDFLYFKYIWRNARTRKPRVLRKPRRRHFSRESRALVSGGAAQGAGGLNAWSAGGTGFYGKTTLTRTLDLPLPVEDIARRRRRQSVRFEATFTGLHEGSASLSVLAGITFHVLCVPNHRYSGPYLCGREEQS